MADRGGPCRSELAREKPESTAGCQAPRVIVGLHREQARSYRLFQVTRRQGGTLSGRYRSNGYVHQEENARPSVAIAGKSDRRTAASTGIGVSRDCVKNP